MRSGLVALVIAAPFVVGVAVADPGPEGESVFTFQDREINESSGLVVLDDVAVTVNDSGDSSRIFVVSPDEGRSEEHTSELQSLMRISYAVFCLKKQKIIEQITDETRI